MISAILLNWKRPGNVARIADSLRSCDLVDEVVVWNNNPDAPFRHDGVTAINASRDLGLYSRFAAACLARNECVLIQDDDLELPEPTLRSLHGAWSAAPDILHGLFGRKPSADGSYDPRDTAAGEAPILLCRALLMHRKHAGAFFAAAESLAAIQAESLPHGNGEDIILSYAVRKYSGRLHRVHRLPVVELPAPHAIHVRWAGHLAHRGRLLRSCEAWLNANPTAVAPTPRRIHNVLSDGATPHRFNPSLIRFEGRWLMAYRVGRTRGRIVLAELDDDFRVIAEVPLALPHHPDARDGQEDPRLFHYRGELWMSHGGLARPRNSLFLARLSPGGEVLEHVALESPTQQSREKNWTFFDSAGVLHAVYHGSPHRVLRISNGRAELLPGEGRFVWSHGEVRGGAPPVLVDGEWYHWAHGWLRQGQERPLYSICLYTFADRSFELKRFARMPIYQPNEATPAGGIPRVVFPAGAVLDGNRWLVSVGEYDSRCRVLEFPQAKIEALLEDVP